MSKSIENTSVAEATPEQLAEAMSLAATEQFVRRLNAELGHLMAQVDSIPMHPRVDPKIAGKYVEAAKRDIAQGFSIIARVAQGIA